MTASNTLSEHVRLDFTSMWYEEKDSWLYNKDWFFEYAGWFCITDCDP